MRRFSDFARSANNLDGEKISMDEVLGRAVVVRAFRVLRSKYDGAQDCVQVQLELDGAQRVLFTASVVLLSQLRDYEAELPFETAIRREGKYFTFT